ncbi:DUF3179 domain-containing protein [bacterium AH-315-E10]|nr:DUF3179 domain-containing protein [bacterium AH-315-E10]
MEKMMSDDDDIVKLKKRFKWVSVACIFFAVHFVAVNLFPSYFFYDRIIGNSYNTSGNYNERGNFFEKDGHRYLFGGQQEHEHFKIDNLILDDTQFHYGLGRENFPAVVNPRFEPADLASSWLNDNEAIIGISVNGESKAYPIRLLQQHEVVNDTVGGESIFASYCVLASLASVYNRKINDHEFTFAVSGYTYADMTIWGGMDAFVLWDRDTESLWWPPMGKAV